MQSCNYNLDDFTQDVYTFNQIAGNDKQLDKESFKSQMKCLTEEVWELHDEINNWNDPVNLTKEVIDVIYVAIGFLQKLENFGIDVSGALREVAENNLMKFPDRYSEAVKTQNALLDKEVATLISQDENTMLYVVRNLAGKVMKPYDYVKSDVSQFVPIDLKLEGGENE